MSVYVDNARVLWRGKRWCHLYADSLPELESFAREIGLKPEWLQNADAEDGLPHYDVTGAMLDRARAFGAISVTSGDGTYRRLRRAQIRGTYPMGEQAACPESDQAACPRREGQRYRRLEGSRALRINLGDRVELTRRSAPVNQPHTPPE